MGLTVNLKKQVDLPVFEWLRPLPVANHLASAFTTANTTTHPHIYYILSGALWRYNTEGDSWHQLSNPQTVPLTMVQIGFSASQGIYGRVITGYSGSLEIAGFNGSSVVGKKIKILDGLGAGQERIITGVSGPIVKDKGVVSTASSVDVQDISKVWANNQYRDHQVRIVYGGGLHQVRTILWNSSLRATVYDLSQSVVTPWWGAPFYTTTSATAGSQSLYQIESYLATVDSGWSTIPDRTSSFVIQGGGMWMTTPSGAGPFFNTQYYDSLSDIWYQKTSPSGLLLAQLATDASFERFTEAGGVIISGTALSGSANQLFHSGTPLEVQRWNNFELRIVSGIGMGQVRTILANNSGFFTITENWRTIPDSGSLYEVYRDCGKLMLIGNAQGTIYQYSQSSDQWTTSQQLEHGIVRNASAQMSGNWGGREAMGCSGTRTPSGVTGYSVASGGLYYLKDQILTTNAGVGGGAIFRINSTNEVGSVLSVILELPGTGYTTGLKGTSVTPVGGTGCVINVVGTGQTAALSFAPLNHYFQNGDNIFVTGFTESEYNGYKTIVTNAQQVVYYAMTGTPTTPATITLTNSISGIIDVTKSWKTGALIGNLIQLCSGTTLGFPAYTRVITGNTDRYIGFTSIPATPLNGQMKYVICAPKAFGTEESIDSMVGSGNMGFATSGTSGSLTDTTKNWMPNYWARTLPTGAANSGRFVRIFAGTGAGSGMTITGNSSNTLYFTPQVFTPNESTFYRIMDNFGRATAGAATTLTDTSQNWATNVWAGKRVRLIGGTAQGNEYAITSNTQTTLTFASATAPDATTAYSILALSARGLCCHIDCVMGCSDPNINNKYLYIWRGGATVELARYNIAKQTIEYLTYSPLLETLTTGSMYCYDGGDKIYFIKEATGRIMYYDITKNIIVPAATIPYNMGTACIGNRMEIITTEDGLKFLYLPRHSAMEFWRTLLFI